MEKRYKNVRAWLLAKERYEDLIKFDSSAAEKMKYLIEMETGAKPKISKWQNPTGNKNRIDEVVYKIMHRYPGVFNYDINKFELDKIKICKNCIILPFVLKKFKDTEGHPRWNQYFYIESYSLYSIVETLNLSNIIIDYKKKAAILYP
ncbi:MAG: hypothetical protein LBQ74_14185 [Prevotella sp.]|nr:hypothetical protein [Prevotella sp.]